MQQRKGASGIIELRTTHDAKAEALVEGARSIVLLVHVHRQRSASERLHVRHQAPTTAAPVYRRIEEERLDLVVHDPDEAERRVVRIHQNPEVHRVAVQFLRNERTQALDIGAREKVMRRTHRALPDAHQRGSIRLASWAYGGIGEHAVGYPARDSRTSQTRRITTRSAGSRPRRLSS